MISVVSTNDAHGVVESVPWVAGYVANLREQRVSQGGGVLLVDAGDMWQGTLAANLGEGASMVAAYSAAGYDAVAVGNHEFDYGPVGMATVARWGEDGRALDAPFGALRQRVLQARFPFLSANLRSKQSAQPFALPQAPSAANAASGTYRHIYRRAMIERSGVRIGVVGLGTQATLTSTLADNVRDLEVLPLAATLRDEARQLRQQGAHAVVALVHAGGDCKTRPPEAGLQDCDPNGEAMALAQELPPGLVDVLATGHTHTRYARDVAGMALLQAGAHGWGFARADLSFGGKPLRLLDTRVLPLEPLCWQSDDVSACSRTRYAGKPVIASDRVTATIAPALAQAQALRNRSLNSELVVAARHRRYGESPLGNLFCDWLAALRPQAHLTVMNHGGIRRDLPAGRLTYGDLYEAHPFDNRLAWVDLSAAELASWIGRAFERPTSSRYALGASRVALESRAGAWSLTLLTPHGVPRPAQSSYRVLTNEYVATRFSGPFAQARSEGRVTVEQGPPLRDLIAAHLQANGGRIDPGAAPTFDLGNPRVRVHLQ